jgi:hypothetical protein
MKSTIEEEVELVVLKNYQLTHPMLIVDFIRSDKKLIGYDATKTRGLNQAELNSIVSEQKGQIAKTKREASQEDNKTKRNKRRGGGGLLSKAKPIEVKGLATAMPDLGVMSLYGSDSTLGVK